MAKEISGNRKKREHLLIANAGEYPLIVALQGPLSGRKWELVDEITIGRDEDCDIAISDRQVSRLHARVANLGNNHILLEDLGSKNGTLHQGKTLEGEVVLEDGDIFQIALIQKFAYYVSDATMPLEDFPPLSIQRGKKITLDSKSRRVWVNGQELQPPLSAPQFRLLDALSKQPGKVISRDDLILLVWKDEERNGISEQAFDALIRRLRSRLAEVDPETNFLVTIRGHGLRLDE